MKRLVCTLVVLGLITGCSSIRISTDYAEAADFTAFRTFRFKETDDSLAGTNPLVHQRIVDALNREMKARDFTAVESDPDVYISYYGKVGERIVLNTVHMDHAWGASWHWGKPSLGQTSSTVTTYDRGTLVIDVWEAEEKELVWRGTVADVLGGDQERLDRGITQVFRRFPPS